MSAPASDYYLSPFALFLSCEKWGFLQLSFNAFREGQDHEYSALYIGVSSNLWSGTLQNFSYSSYTSPGRDRTTTVSVHSPPAGEEVSLTPIFSFESWVQFADQFSETEAILTTFDAFLVNFCTLAIFFGRKFAKNLFFLSVVLSLLPCIQLKITHWVSSSDVCGSYTNFKALYNRNKVLACEPLSCIDRQV